MGEVFYRIADRYVSVAWGEPVFVDIYDLSGDFSGSLEVSGSQEDITVTLEERLPGSVKTGLSELGQAIHVYFQDRDGKQASQRLERFRVDAEELADVGLA